MDTHPELAIDGLIAELKALAEISAVSSPVVTRVVFSDADLRARAYVKKLFAGAGLAVNEDAIGNISLRAGKAVSLILHRWVLDRTSMRSPNAGLYDGCVGVLGGLEAIRGVKAAWVQSPTLN